MKKTDESEVPLCLDSTCQGKVKALLGQENGSTYTMYEVTMPEHHIPRLNLQQSTSYVPKELMWSRHPVTSCGMEIMRSVNGSCH
jgi:hypothetical protein